MAQLRPDHQCCPIQQRAILSIPGGPPPPASSLAAPSAPGAAGGQLVVLHLVLQRDKGPDGIKQWQATGLIDDQLQVSHKDSHIHGPAETRGTLKPHPWP